MSDFVVGLTGGIGSGKSAAADAFAALGVSVVDTDAIAHELTVAGGAAMPALAAAFGAGGVIPAMAVMSAGQEYDKARNAGLDPAAALADARPASCV